MNQKEFNKKLKEFGKITLPILIPIVGLKNNQAKALIDFYVKEMSYYEIGEELGLTPDSVGNLICLARKEFNRKLEKQRKIIPLELIPYLDLFNENEKDD